MTDKEKKAIERFKNFIYTYQDVIEDEYSDYEEKESAKEYQEVSEKILNLIEKQSKEIEELKNGQIDFWISDKEIEERIRNKFVSKDKIKAKIEEYKKQIEKMEKDDIGRGFTLGKEWSDLKAKVEFGQSLLEKE